MSDNVYERAAKSLKHDGSQLKEGKEKQAHYTAYLLAEHLGRAVREDEPKPKGDSWLYYRQLLRGEL